MSERVILLARAPTFTVEGGNVIVDFGINNVPMFALSRNEFLKALARSRKAVVECRIADVAEFRH